MGTSSTLDSVAMIIVNHFFIIAVIVKMKRGAGTRGSFFLKRSVLSDVVFLLGCLWCVQRVEGIPVNSEELRMTFVSIPIFRKKSLLLTDDLSRRTPSVKFHRVHGTRDIIMALSAFHLLRPSATRPSNRGGVKIFRGMGKKKYLIRLTCDAPFTIIILP